MARILVVDDQTVYRTGIRSLISTQIPDAEVLEASSLPQALRQIQDGAFDLVLLDLDLSDSEAVEALTSAREASPATRIAILSASDARADILANLAAGFHGFISKHQSDAAILDAIIHLLSGRIYVPRSIAEADDGEASVSRGDKEGEPLVSIETSDLKLTKRQQEVLVLLALGMSNKEIARALEIAEATTKIHMAALLRALGVRNRTEAAYKAGKILNSAKLAPNEDPRLRIGRRDFHSPQALRDRRREVGLVRAYGTGIR